jgi:hypothetical protein
VKISPIISSSPTTPTEVFRLTPKKRRKYSKLRKNLESDFRENREDLHTPQI